MAFIDVEPEESSEYRNETFTDIISSIGFEPKEIKEELVDMVQFCFDNGAPLDFFQPDDWAKPESYRGMGRVINGMRKSGVHFKVDPVNQIIVTEPSLIGATVRFVKTVKQYTSDGVAKEATNWDFELIELSDGVDNASDKKQVVDDKELLGTVIKDIEILLKGHPEDMRGIIRGYGALVTDRDVRLPRLKLKEKALDEMISLGLVELKGDTYSLI